MSRMLSCWVSYIILLISLEWWNQFFYCWWPKFVAKKGASKMWPLKDKWTTFSGNCTSLWLLIYTSLRIVYTSCCLLYTRELGTLGNNGMNGKLVGVIVKMKINMQIGCNCMKIWNSLFMDLFLIHKKF